MKNYLYILIDIKLIYQNLLVGIYLIINAVINILFYNNEIQAYKPFNNKKIIIINHYIKCINIHNITYLHIIFIQLTLLIDIIFLF